MRRQGPSWGSCCAAWLLLSACDEARPKTSAPLERSQAVAASPAQAVAPAAPVGAARASATSPAKPRRALCDGQLRDGKPLPKKPIGQAQANGVSPLPNELTPAASGFTWVNFWAAWCAPCKEEIPRLLEWERTLSKSAQQLRVVFVSIDDDERQLRGLLDAGTGPRATYWLKEGRQREDWMKAAGLEVDPELPVHLLVDARGKVRCKVQGAVEDSDLADLERLLASAR